MAHAYAPESEQESDLRLHDRQTFSVIRRNSVQNLLQGQFINGQISKEAYYQQIRTIFELFHSAAKEGPWEYMNLTQTCPSLCADFIGNYPDIYARLEEIAATGAQLQRALARLDILKNLIEHCGSRTDGSISYTHYHMYGTDTFLYDDNTFPRDDKTDVITEPLTAAIDCTIKSITTNTITSENVLWIESFVSFQKGTGQELLRHLLRDDKNRDIDYVALAAYPGTENYYRTTLGMQELPLTYAFDEDGEIIDVQAAILEIKKSPDGQEGMSDADCIKRGLDKFVFECVK
ncbi:MAG: hypothetical protein NC254_14370 [bacterium]|nr:hypothetical protein [bacterium]